MLLVDVLFTSLSANMYMAKFMHNTLCFMQSKELDRLRATVVMHESANVMLLKREKEALDREQKAINELRTLQSQAGPLETRAR